MKYRRLGNSGLAVSEVGLGCNNLGRPGALTEQYPGAKEVVHAALDAGITLFDTADCYGKEPGLSETFLGQAIKGQRDQVILATKFGMDLAGANGPDYSARGSRRYIMQAVEASLQRLGTDYIDLYQYHTPDHKTPVSETLEALDDLVRSGKVRYIGHSNFAGWQIAEAEYVSQQLGTSRFISSESHYNLLDRRAELEVVPATSKFGIGLLPYFPLANGLLTGKYSEGVAPAGSRLSLTRKKMLEEADLAQLRSFREFAQARGLTELQVAFSWLAAQQPVASVIAGATTPAQIKSNAEAVCWTPTPADLTELDQIFPRPANIALF